MKSDSSTTACFSHMEELRAIKTVTPTATSHVSRMRFRSLFVLGDMILCRSAGELHSVCRRPGGRHLTFNGLRRKNGYTGGGFFSGRNVCGGKKNRVGRDAVHREEKKPPPVPPADQTGAFLFVSALPIASTIKDVLKEHHGIYRNVSPASCRLKTLRGPQALPFEKTASPDAGPINDTQHPCRAFISQWQV